MLTYIWKLRLKGGERCHKEKVVLIKISTAPQVYRWELCTLVSSRDTQAKCICKYVQIHASEQDAGPLPLPLEPQKSIHNSTALVATTGGGKHLFSASSSFHRRFQLWDLSTSCKGLPESTQRISRFFQGKNKNYLNAWAGGQRNCKWEMMEEAQVERLSKTTEKVHECLLVWRQCKKQLSKKRSEMQSGMRRH